MTLRGGRPDEKTKGNRLGCPFSFFKALASAKSETGLPAPAGPVTGTWCPVMGLRGPGSRPDYLIQVVGITENIMATPEWHRH